jgi:hypothetical protein
MERIGQGNCVVVVVSDKYIRSPNCMFELVEIADNKQFHDRVFPVVLADADIYDPVKRLGYVKYWEDKRNELAEAIKTVDPANLQGIRDDMDLYDRIRDKVSGLVSILKDMNTLTPEMHQDSNFSQLYEAVEKRIKENPSLPNTETKNGAPAVAVGGLMALPELMQRFPDVRNTVNAFQNDFKVAHKQVNLLGDYKDLHDQLHKLQFHCYNGIVQAAARFPNDDQAIDNVTDYALTLEGIIEELKQIAAEPSMPKQELVWINDLGQVKADLRNAVDNLDGASLKKVIWSLNRLLTMHPARINSLLNFSAHSLHLSELLNALLSICNTLTSLDLDKNKVAAFQSGMGALNELSRILDLLVDDHDHWQSVDVELRRIEATLDRDVTELQMWWPTIKSMADPLYITNPEEWAAALKHESDGLEEAMTSNNPLKVRRCFRSYQRRVTDRFYRVDVKLKALCADLRQIGAPLAAILEMIL